MPGSDIGFDSRRLAANLSRPFGRKCRFYLFCVAGDWLFGRLVYAAASNWRIGR
jgi:hypothetical protein